MKVNEKFIYLRECFQENSQLDIDESRKIFTALLRRVEEHQAQVLERIRRKQASAEERASRLLTELELELTELQKRRSEMERLSHSDDHLQLLQVRRDGRKVTKVP